MQPSLFEALSNKEGLYAIRINGEKNIRVLFVFKEIEGVEKVILLCCFQKKDTKDYEEYGRIAISRCHEIFDDV